MRRRCGGTVAAMMVAALAAGCGGVRGPAVAPVTPAAAAATVPHLEERALLLLLVDRQIFEPFTVEQSLLGDAALREDLAFAMGRVPDARAARTLRGLLEDQEPAVRRAAAFALGLHAESAGESRPPLLRALRDRDRQVAALAVESLARLKTPLADVQRELAPLAEAERWARLLPALFRFQEDATVPAAVAGLATADPALRARAAYALARYPRPAGALALRGLLADGDPWVRGWAARGLGAVGDADDLARLRPLLADGDASPVIEALRAGAKLVATTKVAAPADWRTDLLRLLGDARAGVRVAALEVAGTWGPNEALAAALRERLHGGPLRERQLALLALATMGDVQAPGLVAEAARAPEVPLRGAAAEAAQTLRDDATLALLAGDASPAVRTSALAGRLALASAEQGEALARAALADADPVVRGTALDWASEHPRIAGVELAAALTRATRDTLDDAARSAVAALAARARAVPAERAPVVATLRATAQLPDWLLRRAAADALADLGESPPAIGQAGANLPVAAYRDMVLASRGRHRVAIETDRGTMTVELACEQAPLTCASFLSLAAQGFYDGLRWHRVVPDFVVQGGDPRGDGSGGPGYTIRDEINLLRYDRGVLGMALSGPDTGGSQFFVTLTPQPHLDGGYTAFGRVVDGLDVLDRLEQWDTIQHVRVLDQAGGGGR